jgi:hypothetical protein
VHDATAAPRQHSRTKIFDLGGGAVGKFDGGLVGGWGWGGAVSVVVVAVIIVTIFTLGAKQPP